MENASIEIIEVRNIRELRDFHSLPFHINKENHYWVPPLIRSVKLVLDKKKNPYWNSNEYQLFLAYQDKKPVGRIAAIVNKESREEGY